MQQMIDIGYAILYVLGVVMHAKIKDTQIIENYDQNTDLRGINLYTNFVNLTVSRQGGNANG